MVAMRLRPIDQIQTLEQGFDLLDSSRIQIDDLLDYVSQCVRNYFHLETSNPLYHNIMRSIEDNGMIVRGMAIYEHFVFCLQTFYEIHYLSHDSWQSFHFAEQLKKYYWGFIVNMRRSDTSEGRMISQIIDFHFPIYASELSPWTENDMERHIQQEIIRLNVDSEYFRDLILIELIRCYPLLGEYELDLMDS